MENLTIKFLDMIFLTGLGCMNIIRLLRHLKTPKKLKKAKKIFEGQIKGHHPILSNPQNFFGFYEPFGSQKSAIAVFFISKAFKAKKATKKPKIANFRKRKGLGTLRNTIKHLCSFITMALKIESHLELDKGWSVQS